MPIGNSSQRVPSNNGVQEKQVIFQKYFKSGARTYATQVKVAPNGKRCLVLTEGVRDEATQEVKKHLIHVFDRDLKEFFAMMQQTVLFLRSQKELSNGTIAGVPVQPPQPVAAPSPLPATAPKPPLTPARPILRTVAPKPMSAPAKTVAKPAPAVKGPVVAIKPQPASPRCAKNDGADAGTGKGARTGNGGTTAGAYRRSAARPT